MKYIALTLPRLAAAALALCCACAPAAPLTVEVVDGDGRPVASALVTLSDGSVMPPSAANLEVAQSNAEFDPPVSVVSRGTPVQFPNRDRARHHVYSFSSARTFEIELYKGTPSEPIVFDQNGIVTVGCNVHDWMYGVVYVIDTPFYGITGADGRATFDGPDGDRAELAVWHPDQVDSGVTMPVDLPGRTEKTLQATLALRPTAPRPSRPPPIKPPEPR